MAKFKSPFHSCHISDNSDITSTKVTVEPYLVQLMDYNSPSTKCFPKNEQSIEVKLSHPPNIEKHEISWLINKKPAKQIKDLSKHLLECIFDKTKTISTHKFTYKMPDQITEDPECHPEITFICRNIQQEFHLSSIAKPKIPVNIVAKVAEYKSNTAKIQLNWEILSVSPTEMKNIDGFSLQFRPVKEDYTAWEKCGPVDRLIKETSYVVSVPFNSELYGQKHKNQLIQPDQYIFRVSSHNQGGQSHASEPSNSVRLEVPLKIDDRIPEAIHVTAFGADMNIQVQMNRPINPTDVLPVWKINSMEFQPTVVDPTTIKYSFSKNMFLDENKRLNFPDTLELSLPGGQVISTAPMIREPIQFLTKLPDNLEINEGERLTLNVKTDQPSDIVWRLNGKILTCEDVGFEVIESEDNNYLMIEDVALENEGEISAMIVETGEICSTFLFVNPSEDFEEEEKESEIPEPEEVEEKPKVSFGGFEKHEYEKMTSEEEEFMTDSASSGGDDALDDNDKLSDIPEIENISTPESSDKEEEEEPHSQLTNITADIIMHACEEDLAKFTSAGQHISYSSSKCMSQNTTQISTTSAVSIAAMDQTVMNEHSMLVGFGETSMEVFQESTVKLESKLRSGSYSSSGYHKFGNSSVGDPIFDEVEVPLGSG